MRLLELIFGRCLGCEARDYTIAILKEQLSNREFKITEIETRNDQLNGNIRARLDFATGMNRIAIPQQEQQLHSMPRHGGIQSRIARAEAAERAPDEMARRRKDYEDRISALEKPEIEVMENS